MSKRVLSLLAASSLAAAPALAQRIVVVNMVPVTLNTETNQDSEPDITVNPNNPRQIVATAFTPNPSGATATAPVYISTDGGNTWVLNNIVPSGNGNTGDITVALSRNNTLYAGILRGGAGLSMRILRSAAYTGATVMTELLSRASDQPYARVYSPMGGAHLNDDHLHVGHNETAPAVTASATFEQSSDVETAAAPAGLTTVLLERRTPSGQDGPPVRQAIHPDGTVYGVYIQRTATSGSTRTGNVVVVRDDNWGDGPPTYSAVTDPGDGVAGRFVATGVSWVWDTGSAMGQERLGDRAAIAVDPTDRQTVYVAWTDRPAGVTGNTATVHVRRSTDGGQTWSRFCSVTQAQVCSTNADCPAGETCSVDDVRTVAGALNPNLAVNVRGDVGFSFQQLAGAAPNQTWQTHFQQSTDAGLHWNDFILSNAPSNAPARVFGPYLGDYTGLTAVGKDFYGVFSANNTPNNTNFPQGVTYQRNANFTTHTLLDDAGTGAVAVSIDPFFFRVQNQDEDDDFYVRDWTDSATVNDLGIEPSTNPWFFSTSDVWNRRSNAPGAFDANDRPVSQDPRETAAGSNYAFARVHRRNTGSAQTVSLHFLKSELGTGSNYEAAGAAADPTLAFAAGDAARTLSSGYGWELMTTGSTHTCLAVEIAAPNDPIVAPGLTGRAPGWPNPDLMVIYDNNKAQRNMGVYTGAGDSGSIGYWAVVHNAATRVRDMVLEVDRKRLGRATVRLVGNRDDRLEGSRLVLRGMEPGENRWVALSVPMRRGAPGGEETGVTITETLRGLPLNGFTLKSVRATLPVAARQDMELLAGNLRRIGHLFGDRASIEVGQRLARSAGTASVDGKAYVSAFEQNLKGYAQGLEKGLASTGGDPFQVRDALNRVGQLLPRRDPNVLFPAISNLNHAVDAFLTYLDKQKGDVADVAQNMRLLVQLLGEDRRVARMPWARSLAGEASQFDRRYGRRQANAADFVAAVKRTLPSLVEVDRELQLGQARAIDSMRNNAGDAQAMQKAHRDFLIAWLRSTKR